MSTRATIHFTHAKGAKPEAIIYRHGDGYPSGLGRDLAAFLDEIQTNVPDTCFDDPSYLAARWVVCDAARMSQGEHPLNFLSVGVVDSDPGDIEYRYTMLCAGKRPSITCEKV